MHEDRCSVGRSRVEYGAQCVGKARLSTVHPVAIPSSPGGTAANCDVRPGAKILVEEWVSSADEHRIGLPCMPKSTERRESIGCAGGLKARHVGLLGCALIVRRQGYQLGQSVGPNH